MSNIIDTVKRAVTGDSTGKNNTSTATDSSYGPGGASAQRSNFATTGDHDTTGIHDRGIPHQSDVVGGAKHNQQGGSLLGKMTDPRGEFDRDTQVGSGAGSRHTGAGTGFSSTTHGSTNHGPHDSNVLNKADPRVDSDRDGRATHGSTGLGSNTHGTGLGSNTHGTGLGSNTHGSTNAGPHDSNMMNKLDPRVDSDRDDRGASHHKSSTVGGFGMGSTDHATSHAHPDNHHTKNASGPHNSNVLNKLDPRVDSDRDNRANPASHTGGLGNTHAGQHDPHVSRGNNFGTGDNTGTARTFGTTTHNTTHLPGSGNTNTHTAGPHNSDALNKADPRVDSDRDGRAAHHNTIGSTTHGTTHMGSTAGTHGVQHGTGAFAPSAYGTQSTGPGSALGHGTSTNAGPHDSNAANKLDPRVDSDRDGRAHHGTTGAMGAMGSNTHHNTTTDNHGPHNSKMANKLDPRVDSDRDHRADPTSHTGTHNTQHTAGPHNSDALNKADPRVDSDRDGRAHHGTTGVMGSNTHHNTTDNDGPHNSKMANKADPRVDSDRDHRANPTHGTDHHTNQHVSSMVDGPTVGSHAPPKDLGAHGTHGNTTHTGAGNHGSNTTHGPGGLNKHSGATGTNLPGPAPNTAGPHKSDILNKLDPRVDSDRDGSKTIGSEPKY